MLRRAFIAKSVGASIATLGGFALPVRAGRTFALDGTATNPLHNGIMPPSPFPPTRTTYGDTSGIPYYIEAPPVPIVVNVGRQLFVDDFLVEHAERLTRTFHSPSVHDAPLISPGEDEFSIHKRSDGREVVSYFAAPYSDGVWWDAYQRRFRAWILSGQHALRLAESDDGIIWHRAVLADGSPIIMEVPTGRDSGSVWIDFESDDPSQRYKMSQFRFMDMSNWLYTSSDGLVWPSQWDPGAKTAHYSANPGVPSGDRTTFFRDPFRGKWVWSLRDIVDLTDSGGVRYERVRRFAETDNFIADAEATALGMPWLRADESDTIDEAAQLYNVDGLAYESLMLFMLTVWTRPDAVDEDGREARPKSNAIHLGFSRDGFHIVRPPIGERKPFLQSGEPSSWNEGNVQSVGSGMVVVGPPEKEELYIYFSGRENELDQDDRLIRRGHMGVAKLRRDGFASFRAGPEGGLLTTRLVRFDHTEGFLFVNAKVNDGGELRAEVLSADGVAVDGFGADECHPISVDSTRQIVTWDSAQSISRLSGGAFRLRFHLSGGEIFSFWISPSQYGTSNGFLPSGGPRYLTYRDNQLPAGTATRSNHTVPRPFELLSSSPNPFSATTQIKYRLVWPLDIDVGVYDLLGRRVATLHRGHQSAGMHVTSIDASDWAPGIYLCRMVSGNQEATLKMILSR